MDADAGCEGKCLIFTTHFAAALEHHKNFVHVAVSVGGEAGAGRDAGLGELGQMREAAVAEKDLLRAVRVMADGFVVQCIQIDAVHSLLMGCIGVIEAIEQMRAQRFLGSFL